MKNLENILDRGEKLIATHTAIVQAIAAAETDLRKLDAELFAGKARAELASADLALGKDAKPDSALAALHSLQVRRDSVVTLLAGLRSRLVSVEHSTALQCTLEAIQGSDELAATAKRSAVEAQVQIDQAAAVLLDRLRAARGLEIAIAKEFVRLPDLPSATIDPVALQHAGEISRVAIVHRAEREALRSVAPNISSLPELISRAHTLKNDLVRAAGEVTGERTRGQRARYRQSIAARAAAGLQPPNGFAIARDPSNRPRQWQPGATMMPGG